MLESRSMGEEELRFVSDELRGDGNETKDEDQFEADEAIVHENETVCLEEVIRVNQCVESLCVFVNQLSSKTLK